MLSSPQRREDRKDNQRRSSRNCNPQYAFFRAALFAFGLAFLPAPCRLLAQITPDAGKVGIEEKLGAGLPLDVVLRDESGKPVRLGEVVDRPAILTFVYFRCPGICTPLLDGLADVLNRVTMEPGKDFTVVTVSFDPADGPERASEKRKNYLQQLKRPYPPERWRFLTADEAAIARLTGAAGFRYSPDGKDFIHPAALIVLSPKGKIVRYLYGVFFQPFDLKMALVEASEGRVGATVKKALLLCFSYDRESRKYVVNATRVGGAATLLMALCFFGYIAVKARRGRVEERESRRVSE